MLRSFYDAAKLTVRFSIRWQGMKKNDDSYPSWFLWIYERGFVLGLILLVFAVVGVFMLAQRLDERLGGIEERLTQTPPKSYQPPDLSKFVADEIPAGAEDDSHDVYLPIYSHVYYNGGQPFPIESTLSIRNIDRTRPVYIASVEYFDTDGKKVKTFVDQTIQLAGLQTIEFLVPSRDSVGGSGANFVVRWFGEEDTNAPLIEAVMVGSVGTQAISFRASGTEMGTK